MQKTIKLLIMLTAVACVSLTVRAQSVEVTGIKKLNSTTVEVICKDGNRISFDFYGDNIFRLFRDIRGGLIRNPESNPKADILVNNPRKPVSKLVTGIDGDYFYMRTPVVEVRLDKKSSCMTVIRISDNQPVVKELNPTMFDEDNVSLTLSADSNNEYFYGGGVQNGRFSHKGKIIAIENQNSWTDGGVASPVPFYWSTAGYGVMFHTFRKGKYDFDSKRNGEVILSHSTDYLDVFFMVNNGAVALLNDYYQLTGNPVLLPKFGFYEGHLNAYNRDYWKENEKGILFEDGKRYSESQKDNGGVKESLNGELNNYQFSARGVIDRYNAHDMPLGWILPNDGYGAGYGQTETLDGNIANLKSLSDYAHGKGVEVGLWTQSDLHPKAGVSALLQRDIVKEVRDAGVRVLKTDVAWVGSGYSFGLNGIADVSGIMTYYGNEARPFIISLDGWAGTQRYAGVWSGDQTGGVWEYIRFHIPTYIGSGLSGMPNISSDMDGIFGGRNAVVNMRDFQWKTFTPMQLNMDGWGANEKYPHALGEPATSVNRWYLKLKSEIMPYTYSIARTSVDGMPMIRAMFLEYPNKYTHGSATQYQFMYGPDFLVAPIFEETEADEAGNDIRNGIYLPDGEWVDYFTGERYTGGRIINNFKSPFWKLPVFVRSGAIIPVTEPNNNVSEIKKDLRMYDVYPHGNSSFSEYDDDGRTVAYTRGYSVTTDLKSTLNEKGEMVFYIAASKGSFDGFERNKYTVINLHPSEKPKKISLKIGNSKVKLTEVNSLDAFEKGKNVYFYDAAPELNKFATKGSDFASLSIKGGSKLMVKTDVFDIVNNDLKLTIADYKVNKKDHLLSHTGTVSAPANVKTTDENITAYTLKPTWDKQSNADYYEIEFDGMIYSTIQNNHLTFTGLVPETTYSYKIRSVNMDGVSQWDSYTATTKSNPLEFAIQNITAETSVKNQGGQGINKLFNFDEGDAWHTSWSEKAVPFNIIINLNSVNHLDKMEYLPRTDGGNGILLTGSIYTSVDRENWVKAGDFKWDRSSTVKTYTFDKQPVAQYVKIDVTSAVGNYGSGRELYIFKVPGSESYRPGDINADRLIDMNDFTSYLNYTGLRMGDSDFEGYISNGDINKNGLIDAYDISVLTTQLGGGAKGTGMDKIEGSLKLTPSRNICKAGDSLEIRVKGSGLKSVNALSFAIPYKSDDLEFIGVEPLAMKEMENMSNDRLHTNGQKALYPTFANIGDKPVITSDAELDLFVIKFKVKRAFNAGSLIPSDGMLIDKNLNVKHVSF